MRIYRQGTLESSSPRSRNRPSRYPYGIATIYFLYINPFKGETLNFKTGLYSASLSAVAPHLSHLGRLKNNVIGQVTPGDQPNLNLWVGTWVSVFI